MTKKILFFTGIILFTNIVHAAGYTTPPRARTYPSNQAPQRKTKRDEDLYAFPNQIYDVFFPRVLNFTIPPTIAPVVPPITGTYAPSFTTLPAIGLINEGVTSRVRGREYPAETQVAKRQRR